MTWSLLDLPPSDPPDRGQPTGTVTGVLVSYDAGTLRATVRLFGRDMPVPAAPGVYVPGAAVQVRVDAGGRPVLVLPPASLEVVESVPGSEIPDGADTPVPIVVGPPPDTAGTDLADRLAAAASAVAHLDDVTATLAVDLEELAASTALVDGRVTTSEDAPTPADVPGKPDGALWYRYTDGALVGAWRLVGGAWDPAPLDRTFLPAVDIATGTFGDLDGGRLVAATVTADALAANLALIRDLIAGTPGGARAVIGPEGITYFGADGTTVVFALDHTGGATFSGQVVGADVIGSVLRTAADGQRIEIDSVDYPDRVQFMSGDGQETTPGMIGAGAEIYFSGPKVPYVMISAPEFNDDSSKRPYLRGVGGGTNPADPGPRWEVGGKLRTRHLDAPLPHARYRGTSATAHPANAWANQYIDALDTAWDYNPYLDLPWEMRPASERRLLILPGGGGLYRIQSDQTLAASNFAIAVAVLRGSTTYRVGVTKVGSGAALSDSTSAEVYLLPGDYVYHQVYVTTASVAVSVDRASVVSGSSTPTALSITRLSTAIDDTW